MIVEYNRFYSALAGWPAEYVKVGQDIQVTGRPYPIAIARVAPPVFWNTGPGCDEMTIQQFSLLGPPPPMPET